MKHLIIFLMLIQNLWAQCPSARYKFREQSISFSKVILIAGAGNENDELYLGYVRYGKYFSIYTQELEKRAIPYSVIHSTASGNEGIKQRTNKLIRQLLSEKQPVLVIGHSVGGLVARLALRNPEAARNVAATITITTPHAGTPVSDWVMSEGNLPAGASLLARALGFDLNQKKYLREISVIAKDQWDTELDHQEHIQNLFSVVAAQNSAELLKSNALFAVGDQIVRGHLNLDQNRMSDGLIPLESQSWGECLLFVNKNHGSVIGKDIFNFPSREVIPQILERLSLKGIEFH